MQIEIDYVYVGGCKRWTIEIIENGEIFLESPYSYKNKKEALEIANKIKSITGLKIKD